MFFWCWIFELPKHTATFLRFSHPPSFGLVSQGLPTMVDWQTKQVFMGEFGALDKEESARI